MTGPGDGIVNRTSPPLPVTTPFDPVGSKFAPLKLKVFSPEYPPPFKVCAILQSLFIFPTKV